MYVVLYLLMQKDLIAVLETEILKLQKDKVQKSLSTEEIILALQNLAQTQSLIKSWEPSAGGAFANFKVRILGKIKNVVVNILNPYARKQEQFNSVVASALIEILKSSK